MNQTPTAPELLILLKHVINTYCPLEYKDKADAKDRINAMIEAALRPQPTAPDCREVHEETIAWEMVDAYDEVETIDGKQTAHLTGMIAALDAARPYLATRPQPKVAAALRGDMGDNLPAGMVKIKEMIADLQSIMDRFGNTCVYIRPGVSWGAVALNRRDDDTKAIKETAATFSEKINKEHRELAREIMECAVSLGWKPPSILTGEAAPEAAATREAEADVERVARELHSHACYKGNANVDECRDKYRDQAKAAIAAMGQPATCHEWKSTPDIKTTPVKCLLCDSEAAVIVHAPDGCTCSPNKYQPRCMHHLQRAWDTGENFVIVEDFRIGQPPTGEPHA